MIKEPDNIILKHLRGLREDNVSLRDEVKRGFRHTNERLSAIESHMEGFHGTTRLHEELIAELSVRIELIEKRIGLLDDQGEH